MKHIILLFVFIFTISSFSQTKVKGQVFDDLNEPIAFANIIFKNSTKGTVSDENGKFYLQSDETYTELEVSFLGFETKILPLKRNNFDLKIILKETGSNLDEVVLYSGKVKKKGNPAIAILRKIWTKKRKNGIYMHPQYEFDKYEKIEFDLNNIDEKFKNKRIFKGMSFIFDKIDTSNITGKPYLPIFINEAMYKKYGKNKPKREIEKLLANKNSGFENNQSVIEFVKQLYVDYDIYDNYLKFFDKSFTSPLSRTGPSVYNYILTDSAFIDNKWCYNIVFYPRRKNELTFKGDFWVNDSTFAVKEIQMAATRSANINWVKEIYIEQEFNVLNDSIFLLKRDHMMSDFSMNKKEKSKGVYGRRTTLYNNYKFDVVKEKSFYTEKIKEYQEEVYNKSDDYWSTNRMEKLNDDENGIYKMLDTLKTVKRFKQMYDVAGILSSGYWQFLPGFDFGPIYSTFGSNEVEGTRIRIGGRSYVKQSDKLRVQGFLAYGFKDEKFKYGIAGQWMANAKNRLIFSVGNRNDVEQTGVSLTTSNNVLDRSFASAALFSRGSNFNLTNLNLTNVGVSLEPVKNLKFRLGATYKTLESAAPEEFKINYLDENDVEQSEITQTEVDIAITYTPGRKAVGFGVERNAVNSGRFPIMYLSYTKGLKDVLNSDFDYHKLQFFYKHRLQVGGIGKLKYAIEVGKTFNDVPLSLLDVVPGNQTPFTANKTFDLLDYYEFVTDEYASMHLEHNFNGRIFSRIPLLRKLNLREIIGVRGIVGTVSESNRLINRSNVNGLPAVNDVTDYRAPEDLYWEYHAGIDNIFKLLRIDFIFRGSHRDLPGATNFAIKGGINFYF